MKKFTLCLIGTALFTAVIAFGVVTAYEMGVKSTYLQSEDGSMVAPDYWIHDYQKVVTEHYNAGYRGGSLDTLAELVECKGVKDQAVLDQYEHMSNVLEKAGELDMNPYPCTE